MRYVEKQKRVRREEGTDGNPFAVSSVIYSPKENYRILILSLLDP